MEDWSMISIGIMVIDIVTLDHQSCNDDSCCPNKGKFACETYTEDRTNVMLQIHVLVSSFFTLIYVNRRRRVEAPPRKILVSMGVSNRLQIS